MKRWESATVDVHIRPAVAVREHAVQNGISLYLSLYADEIDERAEAFWSREDLEKREPAWRELELSDALIYVSNDGSVAVARGAACAFSLYWRVNGDKVKLTTALPIAQGEPFSRVGVLTAVVGACLHSSYEINAVTETPLAQWRRFRRGAVTRFNGRTFVAEERIEQNAPRENVTREEVGRLVREAFDRYTRSQRHVGVSVLEVSGGFDSTLAAAIPSRQAMRGVSACFPYYEFRFEEEVQHETAQFLGIPREKLDGLDLFPYSPPSVPVRFDEPSVFVTGIRHVEAVARFAAKYGAERIYTGHGGDQCFSTDLLDQEPLVENLIHSGPFSRDAWKVVKRGIELTRSSPWIERSIGTLVYDARPDVWVRETFGATMRTPFSDRHVFLSALAWSQWCRQQGRRPDKSLLAEELSHLLPRAIIERKGKVAYDGVWLRAYRRQAPRVANLFEEVRAMFAHLGVSTDWLQRRVLELGEWQEKSDREVLAFYAIALWLSSWGITRPGDVSWNA